MTSWTLVVIVLVDSLPKQTILIGSNIVATKPKAQTKNTNTSLEKTTVTRIKTSDSSAKSAPKAKLVKATKVRSDKQRLSFLGKLGRPFVLIGGYFKGAWAELQLVRWPNRRATWSLTGAVLLFSAFFVVLILLLDALFKYLFEIILT